MQFFLAEDSIMKQMIEIFEEIDGYTIIRGFDVYPVDPEATKAAVEEEVRKNPALADVDLETLFDTYAVYSPNLGPGREAISDTEYTSYKVKFDALGEHECLTEESGVRADFRGTDYWQKSGGRWEKIKIEHIGEVIPAGTFAPDALTTQQREEIAAQVSMDRIAALPPEEKEKEKQAQIKAAIHEAVMKKQEAELEAEVNNAPMEFDSVAWVRERKSEIEALYA
jgi:hypothetical protein